MRAIVFILRSCPAGWLGAYGNEWVGTPNLDQFAAEAVVFDRHISDCPDPTAALAAWQTGRHQFPPTGAPLPAGSRLTELLRAAGVRTVLVRANHPDTDGPSPYYAGWDEVFDARPQPDDNSPLDALIRGLPSLLDRLGEVPRWLVWVETDRLLPPWDVPQDVFEAYIDDPDEEEAERPEGERIEPLADPPTGPFDRSDPVAWDWLRGSFAAVVTALDAELGRVFEQLRGRGLDQTATWLVTSDLGYPLGEHGQVGLHRPWLHEELVHLPLIVRLPGAAEAGRHVQAFTQPADLAPTLLESFGVEPLPEDFHGESLLPLAHGKAESIRAFACSGLERNGAVGLAIRTDAWAMLSPVTQHSDDPPQEPQLFEKPDDRWEVNDLHARNIERADELEAMRQAFVAAAHRPGPLVLPDPPHS